jgi:hypothetical protein
MKFGSSFWSARGRAFVRHFVSSRYLSWPTISITDYQAYIDSIYTSLFHVRVSRMFYPRSPRGSYPCWQPCGNSGVVGDPFANKHVSGKSRPASVLGWKFASLRRYPWPVRWPLSCPAPDGFQWIPSGMWYFVMQEEGTKQCGP